MPKGVRVATRKVQFEINLPDDLMPSDVDEMAKVSFVMDLLRNHSISQGKASELLGISRWDLPDVMAAHGVYAFDYDPDDLVTDKASLRKALGNRSDA